MQTDSAPALIAGIDIGGTNLRCAIAAMDAPTHFLAWRTVETPSGHDLDAFFDVVAAEVAACREEAGVGDAPLAAVGCAAPGVLDAAAGVVRVAWNLNWRDVPLAARLAQHLGAPAAVENDVRAAALAEYRYGAGAGTRSLVYLTVSTGVAAGIVVEGKLLRGSHHAAGELGRFVPDRDHLDQDWAPNGCLELSAAGVGLAQTWRLQTGNPDVTAADVFAAARAGNTAAATLVARAADYLAMAAVAVGTVVDPEVLVLGGSIAQHEAVVAERIQRVASATLAYPFKVVPARLGGDAPLVGALALAADRLPVDA